MQRPGTPLQQHVTRRLPARANGAHLLQYHSSLQRLQRFSAGLPHALRSSIRPTANRKKKKRAAQRGHAPALGIFHELLVVVLPISEGRVSDLSRAAWAAIGGVHISDLLEFPPFFFFADIADKATRGRNYLQTRQKGPMRKAHTLLTSGHLVDLMIFSRRTGTWDTSKAEEATRGSVMPRAGDGKRSGRRNEYGALEIPDSGGADIASWSRKRCRSLRLGI